MSLQQMRGLDLIICTSKRRIENRRRRIWKDTERTRVQGIKEGLQENRETYEMREEVVHIHTYLDVYKDKERRNGGGEQRRERENWRSMDVSAKTLLSIPQLSHPKGLPPSPYRSHPLPPTPRLPEPRAIHCDSSSEASMEKRYSHTHRSRLLLHLLQMIFFSFSTRLRLCYAF